MGQVFMLLMRQVIAQKSMTKCVRVHERLICHAIIFKKLLEDVLHSNQGVKQGRGQTKETGDPTTKKGGDNYQSQDDSHGAGLESTQNKLEQDDFYEEGFLLTG